jgi:hypothetical protein
VRKEANGEGRASWQGRSHTVTSARSSDYPIHPIKQSLPLSSISLQSTHSANCFSQRVLRHLSCILHLTMSDGTVWITSIYFYNANTFLKYHKVVRDSISRYSSLTVLQLVVFCLCRWSARIYNKRVVPSDVKLCSRSVKRCNGPTRL